LYSECSKTWRYLVAIASQLFFGMQHWEDPRKSDGIGTEWDTLVSGQCC